jgi:hypothetical protein
MHGEMSAHLLSDPLTIAYRQLCADTYAVQHPGSPNRQAIQSVAGHLISLYAQLERDVPTPSVHGILRRALHRADHYHWLVPPSFDGVRTVGHFLSRLDRPAIAAREWAADAWQAWAPHREQIVHWYGELFDDDR